MTRHGWTKTLGPALLLGAGLLLAPPNGAPTAWAQADTSQVARPPSLAELRQGVEDRYQVLPVQGGIVLLPRYGGTEIRTIELSNGDVAVDGAAVTGGELRDAIGDDADLLLRLSYMDTTSRRTLFGIGTTPDAVADTAGADSLAALEDTTATADAEVSDRDRASASYDGDRVRIGGGVTVAEDERVDGDVVAVGGSARIDGEVDGDVTAVGGSVHLGPESRVDGDVVSVGGRVRRSSGAVVTGGITENDFSFGEVTFRHGPGFRSPFEGVGGLVSSVVWIVILMLFALIAFFVARQPVERMESRVADSPWKAALVGLASQLLFIPALAVTTIVLAVSIIGIPLLLLIPFALLALAVGAVFGFAAVALRVGRASERRFGWDNASDSISLLVGIGLLMAPGFFGAALDVMGGPLDVFGTILMVIGFLIQYAAWTVGFGALLLTRFGTRASWSEGGPGSPAPTAPPSGPDHPESPAPPVTVPPGETARTPAAAPPPGPGETPPRPENR